MERERERFGGSSDLLSSLENVDLTRFKPRSLSKDHAMEYSWHQPDECLRARRGKAEHRREELLLLLYKENISPGRAEELVKEWIALVFERDRLLKEQMEKERRSAKVEYVRALRQVLHERPAALGDGSQEVPLREALLSLERRLIEYCRNTNISATPYKARTSNGRYYTSGKGRKWGDRFNNSYDASHSFSDSSTPRYLSDDDDSETGSRFETASLSIPERMIFTPSSEPAKPVFTPLPSPTASHSAPNYPSSSSVAATQPTPPRQRSKDETDGPPPLPKEERTANRDNEASSEPLPVTAPNTPPPPPPPFLLPPHSSSSSKKTAAISPKPSPLATSSRKKRGMNSGAAMGTGQFSSTAPPQINTTHAAAGTKLFGGDRSVQSSSVTGSSSSSSTTQPQCEAREPSSLLDVTDDRKSLLDEISSIGQQHLRRTNKARSPGGTPIKHSKNRLTLTNNSDMLQRALISKFRSMHTSSTPIKGAAGVRSATQLLGSADEKSGSFDVSSAWSDINNSVAYEDPDITATSSSGITSGWLQQPRDPQNLSSAV